MAAGQPCRHNVGHNVQCLLLSLNRLGSQQSTDSHILKLQLKNRLEAPYWVKSKLYRVGSDTENHLVLAHASIATMHAHLVTAANQVYLRDNHSPVGSYVNGQRVAQKEVLPGDVIRFGAIELQVRAAEQRERKAAAAGSRVGDA